MAVLKGVFSGQLFPVEGQSVILGRHPDCDIVLESGSVSRQHARISCIGGNYYVEDLRSRNGTFLNGRAVVGRQLLADEDELGICDLIFTFLASQSNLDHRCEREPVRETATALLFDDDRPSGSSTVMSKLDVASGSSGLQLELNPQAKLRALVEILKNLGTSLGLGEVLPKLLDSLFAVFVQADRGFVVLKDRGTGRLVPKAVKHRRNEDMATIRISRTIINNVMTNREAILSADATADSRFDMAESIVDFHIRSMMCAPLIGSQGHALGVIQIDTLDQRKRFNREDLDLLASVACLVAFAVENAQLHEVVVREQALARELAVAHEVQQNLLPAAAPQIERYRFFEFYDPANELGGDYYDYVPLPDGRLAVVVADVSGKGIAAALLMARVSAEARYCLVSEPTPARAITRLNRVFCGSGWEDRFVTLVSCVLDPARHEATVVNAGHLPPLLRRGGDVVEAVGEAEAQLPLGVDADVSYGQCTISLEPGDCLMLYTDGITEAMNAESELYGHDRLWDRLRGATQDVTALGRAILDDVKQFVGSRAQSDDMCLACLGREME